MCDDLLLRLRECVFFAVDLLFLNGDDLRGLPLIERKARLKRLLRRAPGLAKVPEEIFSRNNLFTACLERLVQRTQGRASYHRAK